MSAEDYHDVPGFGGGFAGSYKPRSYSCNFCKAPISFSSRKPFNPDGTQHRCKSKGQEQQPDPKPSENPQVALYVMSAMNAIISGQIQKFGGDYIHHMNFNDVADASWRAAAAMVKAEENYRYEFQGATK